MIYYINGFVSPSQDKSFTSFDDGATNFKELLDNVALNDGDTIRVGGPVDEPTEITLIASLVIESYYTGSEFSWDDSNRGTITTDINNANAFNIYGAGTTISNLEFYTVPHNGILMNVYADSSLVDNCIFGHDVVSTNSTSTVMINLVDVVSSTVSNCRLYTQLTNASYTANGIRVYSCTSCVIEDNDITTSSYTTTIPNSGGIGISIVGTSQHISIEGNIIRDLDDDGSYDCMYVGKLCDYISLIRNGMGVKGNISNGIVYDQNSAHGRGMVIKNNLIYMLSPDGVSSCLTIPYAGSDMASDYTIINNIFIFDPWDLSTTNSTSVAINASIEKGIIDYNNIYRFSDNNAFVSNNAPNVITELGPRNLDTNPFILYAEDPINYSVNELKSFYCSASTEMIGTGYMHKNIGIGVQDADDVDGYINIVDTVTNNMDTIEGHNGHFVTFLNNVLYETEEYYNDQYRGGMGVYPSCVYNNQFEWSFDAAEEGIPYPFTVGSEFYRSDITNIFRHKGDLSPFENIHCPANPGYGYPEYTYYTSGIFGYPRVDYTNACNPDTCIIQDDFITNSQLIDSIDGYTFEIHDTINPPCLIDDRCPDNA